MEIVTILILLAAISMFPLIVDLVNVFIPIGRVASHQTSLILVSTLCTMYILALYYFFALVIPFFTLSSEEISIEEYRLLRSEFSWYDTYSHFSEWSFGQQMFVILGILIALHLWVNTLYSYYSTVMFSPSWNKKKPTSNIDKNMDTKKNDDKQNNKEDKQEGEKRAGWCNICKIEKDVKTHHCRICDMCIPNMDHHCPFTANCISTGKQGNFVYFFLFLFYTTCGCAYVMVNMALPFYYCNIAKVVSERCIPVGNFGVVFLVAIIVTIGTGAFTALHVFLIAFGRSTLDFLNWWSGKTSTNTELMKLEKLKEGSKLHCTWLEFLFPYFISRTPGGHGLKQKAT